jgi:hypothetical protein
VNSFTVVNDTSTAKEARRSQRHSSHPVGHCRSGIAWIAEHLPTEGLLSKAWDEFSQPGSPKLDFVFTVCDQASMEVCPIWPGLPMTVHWGVPHPTAISRNGGRSGTGLSRGGFYFGAQNQPVARPSAEDSRPPCTPARARLHRPFSDDARDHELTTRVVPELPRSVAGPQRSPIKATRRLSFLDCFRTGWIPAAAIARIALADGKDGSRSLVADCEWSLCSIHRLSSHHRP